jgi:hypothetical protein
MSKSIIFRFGAKRFHALQTQSDTFRISHLSYVICKKLERYLQFSGIRRVDQFFLWGPSFDGLEGSDPILEVDEPPQIFFSVFSELRKKNGVSHVRVSRLFR